MKRLKLLAMAALLAIPLVQACGEDPIPPPPTGTVTGQVAVEGDGADGVTVTLSSGVTVVTANGGAFSFTDVEAGTYTVTISNFPDDASFQQTSTAATIAEDGETVTVNFTGAWIRTSAIMGTVTVENDGLSGVTVRITGMSDSETLTSSSGQYSFTGLRAGNYTIEITGFEEKDFDFASATSTAEIAVGESKVVSFEGTYVRASAISVRVSVEGNGLQDVTVSLQGKGENLTGTTNGAGQHLFEDLRRGDYVIGITNPDPDEYEFDASSQTVAVDYGETQPAPFEGIALRTAGIQGTVTIEGRALEGVTVSLQGRGETGTTTTNAAGQWAFDRLHAGTYSIGIVNPDDDIYGFDATSRSVTVERKKTETVGFDGYLLRTAAIEGEVTVKGDALSGVTVTVTGGPKDEDHTTTTNGAGMYAIDDLHAGDYTVAISGYDTDEYGFEVTTKSVSVGLRETAEVAFDGILLRTAGVSGRVTIDGEATSGLTLTLTGPEDRSGMTNANGQYAFSGLAAGEYTLTLSGYDADEYEFDATKSFELELDEAGIENFAGRSLRTVVVMGTVSAEGEAMMGVTVTLTKMLSATAGELLGQMTTGENGGYMFGDLLAATYRIDITGFDDEFDFPTTTRVGPVETDDTAMWNFDAEIIRESSVSGVVTVDGDGMGDITVTLTGDHDTDEEMETSEDGSYRFAGLRKGDYTVTMENPDEDAYDFPTTSRSVSLGVSQPQTDVSFAGSMNRRASISGQVYVEDPDLSLEGVTVKLRGEDRADTETDANGEYNFPGLAGGDYTVSMENPDEDAYIFDATSVDLDGLGDDEAEIVDFRGEHTTTASVSGRMFVDEVEPDSALTDGEPNLEAEDIPVILQGPGLGEVTLGATGSDGAYAFEGLKAGRYRVLLNDNDTVKGALARAGYAFRGQPVGGHVVDVPAATDVDVDFAFAITKQTIYTGAVLANNVRTGIPVGGVRMALYPTAADAEDGTNSLGVATTRSSDPNTGFAKFEFDRAKDKGPGGGAIDYLVFAKVISVGKDLHAHSDAIVEIAYERADRESMAPTAVKLINTRVNFQWSVKSNATAKDGDQPLQGWKATNGSVTNSSGKATYTGRLSASQIASAIKGLPARFSVSMDTDQEDAVDGGELWRQSGSLSHSHTGLENPATNTMANNDLGVIHITWRTQALVLGVYREADDVEGYTNYQSGLPGGDHRPSASVAAGMKIKLVADNSLGNPEPYEYDHDACTNKNSGKTDPREATFTIENGLARASCLPANDEFTITFELGDADRVEVGPVAKDEDLKDGIRAFDEDHVLSSGTTVGMFGDRSGGVPEVRYCLSSKDTSDRWCATWAYQWKNGALSGAFMVRIHEDSTYRAKSIDPARLELDLEAVTTGHGAEADTTSGNRNYAFDDLRDGTYAVSAEGTTRYRVDNGPDTVHVFYDERAGRASAQTRNVEITDLDPPPPPPTGLHIMGYIGNDKNNDKKFRGGEPAEDVSVRLSGHGQSRSTTTDEDGFYEFRNLPKGSSYTITPASTSTSKINRGYSSTKKSFTRNATGVAAAKYPTFEEGDHGLPYWNYKVKSAKNTAVRVSGGGRSATLINFVRLHADGEVEGGVTNLSDTAGAGGIDIIFEDDLTGLEEKIETPDDGEFARTGLLEGATYTAYIEDAGWGIPCMTSSSSSAKPDDDAPKDSDGSCRHSADTIIEGYFEGRGEEDDMGTLWVYDEDASSDDNANRVTVKAKQHGEGEAFDTAVTWKSGWTRSKDSEETSNETSLGTISWKSKSVTLSFTTDSDATYELENGSKDCDDKTCDLNFNATGSRDSLKAKENTLNLTVTAENGYDDHEYDLKVSRAAPVGNHRAKEHFVRVDEVEDEDDEETPAKGDGDGLSVSSAWTMETKGPTGSKLTMRIDLVVLGVPGESNAYCAQSATVKEYNDDDDLDAEDDYEDDVCSDTRYELRVGKLYEIEVRSEDDKAETYYLITRNRDRSGSSRLQSLAVEGDDVTLEHPSGGSDTTKHNYIAVGTGNGVTVAWVKDDENATHRVKPDDANDDLAGHQLTVGDQPNDSATMTIRLISENKEDTSHYALTVRNANDDATLSNITGVTLNEPFAPAKTAYTADVAHDVEEVTFNWATTDDSADAVASPADGNASKDGYQLNLGAEGSDTDLTITVTAEDESTTKTYTVTVSRGDTPPDPTAGVVLTEDNRPFSEDIREGETDTIKVALAAETGLEYNRHHHPRQRPDRSSNRTGIHCHQLEDGQGIGVDTSDRRRGRRAERRHRS